MSFGFVARRGDELEPTPDRMTFGYLDQHDAHAIGVLDPHLAQSPRHGLGRRDDHDLVGRGEALVLGVDVGYLQPQRQGHWVLALRRARAVELEEPSAEEEDHAREAAVGAELPIDAKTEHLGVPTSRAVEVERRQQHPARQHLHGSDDMAHG